MTKFNNTILKNTLQPMLICFMGFVTQYALYIVTAKVLSKSQFGIFSYTLLINTVLATLIAHGTDTNSNQFLNIYLKKHRSIKIHEYISWNIALISKSILCSLVFFTLMFLIIDPFTLFFNHNLSDAAKILTTLFFTVPLYAISNILITYLLCDKKVKLYTYFYFLQTGLLMIGLIYLSLYLKIPLPHLELVLAIFMAVNMINIMTYLIAIYIFSPDIFTHIKHGWSISKTTALFATWRKSTNLQLFCNLLKTLMLKIDFYLLVFFIHSSEELGIYSVALNTAIILVSIPAGIFQHLTPDISLMAKNIADKKALQAKWNKCLLLNSLFLITLTALIIVYANNIVATFYGNKYLAATPILQILAIKFALSTCAGNVYALLTFSGNAYYTNLLYVLNIVLCALTAFILQGYGMIGIAYASLISASLVTLGFIIIINKKLGFKSLGVL